MAAASFAVVKFATPPGNRLEGVFDFTPSTSYPAGGEPMTPSLFNAGMTMIDDIIPQPLGDDGSRLWTYDSVNKKLRIFTAVGTEAAGASDQSTKKCRLLVLGI